MFGNSYKLFSWRYQMFYSVILSNYWMIEVEHDIVNYQNLVSVLTAEAFGFWLSCENRIHIYNIYNIYKAPVRCSWTRKFVSNFAQPWDKGNYLSSISGTNNNTTEIQPPRFSQHNSFLLTNSTRSKQALFSNIPRE